jgi:hypothetical protein
VKKNVEHDQSVNVWCGLNELRRVHQSRKERDLWVYGGSVACEVGYVLIGNVCMIDIVVTQCVERITAVHSPAGSEIGKGTYAMPRDGEIR